MLRYVLLAVLCSVGVAHSALHADIDLIKAQNGTEYLVLTLDATLMQTMEESDGAGYQLRYTIGNRRSGDTLVSGGTGSQTWPAPQDVVLNVVYPKVGTGAIVTYVDILVTQTSNLGQGYVTSGGIGQRQIGIAIEAFRTSYLSFDTKIYGF